MIAQLLRFALRQRFITVLIGLTLVAVGLWAFSQLKIEAYPDISDTQVVVISQYPGRAAEEVEQQVTVPIERALNSAPNVIARRSRTIFGLSVVELTFDYGTNDYFARQVVLEKLRDADLPDGVTPGLGPLSTPIGELYRYTLSGGGLDSMKLRELAPTAHKISDDGSGTKERGPWGTGTCVSVMLPLRCPSTCRCDWPVKASSTVEPYCETAEKPPRSFSPDRKSVV